MEERELARIVIKSLPRQEAIKIFAAEALLQITKPKKGIGTELFEALFHIIPQVAVEAVPVDSIKKPTKVFLVPRNDKWFPEKCHCPGTFIRVNESFRDALKRCIQRELGVGIKRFKHSGLVFNSLKGCDKNDRGHTIGIVFLVELSQNPEKKGEWIQGLIPGNLLEVHKDFIKQIFGWPKITKKLFY